MGLQVKTTVMLGRGFGLNKAVQKAARETQSYALEQLRMVTPVRTGYLASRWNTRLNGSVLVLENDAPYAGFVENGTRFMRARPMAKKVAPKARDYFMRRVGYNAITL